MGEWMNSSAAATNYASQATTDRTNATLAKRQAYADAYKLETDSRNALHIAGDNLMTMRRNQTAAVGQRRVMSGASGFAASSGTQLEQETSVAEVLELAIANAAKSSAISDVNAREQAESLRRYGDTTYNVGMVQADFNQRMASIHRKAGPLYGLGSALYQGGMFGLNYGGMFGGPDTKSDSSSNSGE